MYAHFESQDDATLSYVEDLLNRFHTIKDVFVLGQMGKMAKAKANAHRMELGKKRKLDNKRHSATSTPSKKQRETNAWWDYISHRIHDSKELYDDFHVPMIHLMFHSVEQTRRYGSLQQHAAQRHAQAHQMNLKDGLDTSNRNTHRLPQRISFQHDIHCSGFKVHNVQVLSEHRENSTATCEVLFSVADQAALLRSASYAKPEFMGPQNCHEGNHHDAAIKDFRALINNGQDMTHHVAIFNGT